MINHQHKFLFIHIPRTGGTSIELQFDYIGGEDKHWNLNDWKKTLDPDIFENYFKFSFVRNPWDAMISKYKDVWFTEEFPGGPIGQKAGKSLKYFLEHYKAPIHEHGEFFHDYFEPGQMDFIGRFENRKNDLEYISKKIDFDIDCKILKRKAWNKKHYTKYYDDETRSIVAETYAKDIEYFGYKFGE